MRNLLLLFVLTAMNTHTPMISKSKTSHSRYHGYYQYITVSVCGAPRCPIGCRRTPIVPMIDHIAVSSPLASARPSVRPAVGRRRPSIARPSQMESTSGAEVAAA